MKPLLIGEAPSRTSDPAEPLSGRSGQRLADAAGLPLDAFLDAFDRVNLADAWPGRNGKGSSFPTLPGVGPFEPGRTVVVLGKRAARALRLRTDYFLEQDAAGARATVVPHPSGINRWWNDPANAARVRAFLRGVVKEGR